MSSSTRSVASPVTTTREVDADVTGSPRPPVTAVAAAALQLLFAALTTFGVFYFGLVDSARPSLAVGLVLVGVYWSVNAVGVAGSIGLLRRRALGRAVLIGYGVLEFLFSLAKILIWHESAAYVFATLSLVLIALAAAPPTRRYARR
jgi:hypothetical protein